MVTRENHADKRYGLGRSLAPVIDELRHRGIKVGYLCQADAGARSIAAVRSVHAVLNKIVGRFFRHTEFEALSWAVLERLNMGRLAVKYEQRDGYDHVHCHDPIIAAGYRWVRSWKRFTQLRRTARGRWGVTEHGFGCYTQAIHEDGAVLGSRAMRWMRNWEKRTLLAADWVITPTYRGRDQLARDLTAYPIPPTWHAIYHPRPQLNRYSRVEARERLGWSQHTTYLIAVGRFAELKQFPVLIRACAQMQAESWKLVLIGEGTQSPLQALAEELGIGDRLEFAVSDDMGLCYCAADVYVSASLTESFGLANLEALEMGLPALCTAVGGVPEVLGSGAWLIPAGDRVALSNALQELVDNATLREQWARRARRWMRYWTDPTTIADAYLAVYAGEIPAEPERPFQPPRPALLEWQEQLDTWQTCPLPKPLEWPECPRVLVFAPHPDDETLGCGATLALMRESGCPVKVVVMTDGSQGDPLGYLGGDVPAHRRQETLEALAELGIDDVEFLNEPDTGLRNTPELGDKLEAVLAEFPADWILLPSILDYHRDHIAGSLAILTLWHKHGRRQRMFLYEIWSPLPATHVVDAGNALAAKRQAVEHFVLPSKYFDYSTACEGLMSYRGLYLMRAPEEQAASAEAFFELDSHDWESLLAHLFAIRSYQEKALASE